MRALVVLNPNATSTSVRTCDVLLGALSNDLEIEVAQTTHRGHATELARRAGVEGVDVVVAVGGDGTVNEVVNGILAADGRPRRPDLAIIPGGSTNVLARNLGIPESPVEATGLLLDALRSGRRQAMALGRVDGRYFTFTAGFGFDAEVVKAVEAERDGGRRSTVGLYVRAAIRRFAAHPDRRRGTIEVVDDEVVAASGLLVAIVSNCTPWTYIGRRPLSPCPRAELNAGLDVFGLTSLRLIPTLWHLSQLMSRRGPAGRGVVSMHDRDRLVLEAPEPLPLQVDGDYVGARARVEFTSVPSPLDVVC